MGIIGIEPTKNLKELTILFRQSQVDRATTMNSVGFGLDEENIVRPEKTTSLRSLHYVGFRQEAQPDKTTA